MPKYGLESMIVLQEGKGAVVDLENNCLKAGDLTIHELGAFNS